MLAKSSEADIGGKWDCEKKWLRKYFKEQVFPVLTPLAIDPAHPFPLLVNKAIYLLLALEYPNSELNEPTMAVLPVAPILNQVICIKNDRKHPSYLSLTGLIKLFADELFPGCTCKGIWSFRVTRNSDLYINEEEVENLLLTIEEALHKMNKGAAVRLEITSGVDPLILKLLLKAIGLPEELVFPVNGPVNLARFLSVYDMADKPELRYKSFIGHVPSIASHRELLFDNIEKKDILLHHPYESFVPVIDFIQQAANDPNVLAIKQTLYRTNGESPILEALKLACEKGKQVTALIELRARFDEANNINWARELEEAGAHVVYGMVGLKTHCKMCLVVRQEGKTLKRYAHLGTGNYNTKTAKLYSDFSLLTAQTDIIEEVAALFNTLTGVAKSPTFEKLLVAPFNLHEQIRKFIQAETRHAKNGKPARIIAKINGLVDREVIRDLYNASQAGVSIDLIVRGICSLVPGVKGLSENIRVRSIVNRFLEHSRVFYFQNNDNPKIWVGSADWMPRNFLRRVEVVFPITDPVLARYIKEDILEKYLLDNEFAQVLCSDGVYLPVSPPPKSHAFSVQNYFMDLAHKKIAR